ncbi:hypothetical protein [Caulobacter endophyticus]|uniref:hypothetical protein n=1 Tax=Caulobacter endophyticus TaxID=2172652 RepID=UPI001E5D2ABE|nr:hypothetical protein [Caulobacter endophyticus]
MGLDQTRSLAPYASVMAEKSEQNDALLNEIRDLVVETYHGAAKELLTQVKDEPPKARLDASKQVALVGRPVEMLHAAALRSRKISAAKQARIAKAVGEEMAMNDDEPWTAERVEKLHADLERRLGPVGRTLELKRLVELRAGLGSGGGGAGAVVEGGGSPDTAE